MNQKTIARTGTVLFYIGAAVWVLFAVARYLLEWDVTIRQFLPFHLAAVIPGVLLRRCSGYFARMVAGKSTEETDIGKNY